MIFTRRFGALAARPNFRPVDQKDQEPIVDPQSTETELEPELAKVGSSV